MFFIPDPETGGIEVTSPVAAEGRRLLDNGLPPRSFLKRPLKRSVNKASLRPQKYPYWSVIVPDLEYLQGIAVNLLAASREHAEKGRENAAACIGALAGETIEFIALQPQPELTEGLIIPDYPEEIPPASNQSPPDDWLSF